MNDRFALITESPEETEEIAARIADHLEGGEVLLLIGELGAGKTRFTRGLARGLDVDPRQVKSPSYNILHQYDGGRRVLQHFDAYFVRDEEEYRRAGLDDFLADGDVVVVEWGDRHPAEFSDAALVIEFELVDEDRRRILIHQVRETALMARVREALTGGRG